MIETWVRSNGVEDIKDIFYFTLDEGGNVYISKK